jgi:hypothetical protein
MDKSVTYAMKSEDNIIDWNARLNSNQEYISNDTWKEWRLEASSWVTCAVGNTCSIIPRRFTGAPLDLKLYKLGNMFYESIADKDLYNARETLDKIEARSRTLIRLERKNQKQNKK